MPPVDPSLSGDGEPDAPDAIAADPTAADRTAADPTAADPTAADPVTGGDQADAAATADAAAAAATAEDQAVIDVDAAAVDVEEDLDALGSISRQRDDYLDALRHLQADFENYKKRVAKQQVEIGDRAAQTLVDKLLPVLDTADLALAHGAGEGVKQIWDALAEALDKEGLERIDTAGDPFDPNLHDAVAHEPGDGAQEVAEVLRAGYRLEGSGHQASDGQSAGLTAMAPQREWFEKDYYKVLGVQDTATDKEIAKAYRKLAKQYHPDANPGSEDRFKEISAAYDVLGDAATRKEYDEVRRLGPAANPFAGAPGGPPGGFGGAGGPGGAFHVDDLSDLIGNIFNRGAGRAGRPRSGAAGPQRGADLDASLHLSFLEAVNGVTTTVNVTSDVACHTCGGSGAAPGTSPVVCSVCGGRGLINDNQGLFSFSQPCQACGGTGMRVETPCPTCHGAGLEHRARQVKVRIPAGVEDGKRIRVKGRGGAGRSGGPSGDLYVVVHTSTHGLFGRRGGKDLTLSAPVSFSEAALGATITVPTLEGSVSLRVPAGTRSGRTFRVRGRGVPASTGAGDLLVSVDVAVPGVLAPEQRVAVEALGEVMPGEALRADAFGTTTAGTTTAGTTTAGTTTATAAAAAAPGPGGPTAGGPEAGTAGGEG